MSVITINADDGPVSERCSWTNYIYRIQDIADCYSYIAIDCIHCKLPASQWQSVTVSVSSR